MDASVDPNIAQLAQDRFLITLNHNRDSPEALRAIWIRYFGGTLPGTWREVVPLDWIYNGEEISDTMSIQLQNVAKGTKDVYRLRLIGEVSESKPREAND